MFRPFKDLDRYFYGKISFEELIDSCISEMEAGIRYIVENEIGDFEKYLEKN